MFQSLAALCGPYFDTESIGNTSANSNSNEFIPRRVAVSGSAVSKHLRSRKRGLLNGAVIVAISGVLFTSISMVGDLGIKLGDIGSRIGFDLLDTWRAAHKDLATVDHG